jgi:hypothetical protein
VFPWCILLFTIVPDPVPKTEKATDFNVWILDSFEVTLYVQIGVKRKVAGFFEQKEFSVTAIF